MPKKGDLKMELSQLSKLQNEVRLLEDQLQSLRWQREDVNGKIKTDSVKGSMPAFPYILHNITVRGLSDDELGQKYGIKNDIAAVKEQLNERRAACVKEYRRLNEFISGIEDSEMRQILTLRYVSGMSWQQIAFRLGETDEQYPRRKHNKFLDDLTKLTN